MTRLVPCLWACLPAGETLTCKSAAARPPLDLTGGKNASASPFHGQTLTSDLSILYLMLDLYGRPTKW